MYACVWLYSAIFTRRLTHFLDMLDLDLSPHQNVHDHSPEPDFLWVSFCEWRNYIKVHSEVHWLDREESPSLNGQPISGNSEEVGACSIIRLTFCHVEFASRSIVLVAFPSDSFCLIVFSGDAFNIVSDIFAASLFHKGGLFVTTSHGGPLGFGENSCQYDLGSLELGLPHAEPISSKLIYSFLPPVPLTYVVSLS